MTGYGQESMHPIFDLYQVNYYMSVISMKGNTIVQIINEISTQPLLPTTYQIPSLESISHKQGCNRCQFLSQISKQLQTKINDISEQHNKLLHQIRNLIDLNYELFEDQHLKFEEATLQLQKDNKENQEKIKQLESVVEESTKTILQYRNLILEKQEYIIQLEDKIDKDEKDKAFGSPVRQIEILRYHKRQKSTLCNKLEKINLNLTIENSDLKEQNYRLNQKIVELEEYVQRMEEDLANFNVKSPRIINKFEDFALRSGNQFRRNSKEVQQRSATSCEQIDAMEPQYQANQFQNSFSSSFAPNGQALRDVLNISSQTSNYFNFRTREKFQQSNTGQIRNYSNQNIQNDQNSANIMRIVNKGSQKKIMQIKQFEVNDQIQNWHDKVLHKIPQKRDQIVLTTKDYETVPKPSMQIDPYYAFFCLTIQCLKLNWRSLEQVANIGLAQQWDKLLEKQIPMNKWNDYLYKIMVSKLQI